MWRLLVVILLVSGCITETRTGVEGRFLFADGPPVNERMNITLAICNLEAPIPYCTISSDSIWQMPVDGRFSFEEVEPGDYGIAAYVPWIPFVVLLNEPGTDYPLLFEVIEDKWLDLGDIIWTDKWCELDPGVDC